MDFLQAYESLLDKMSVWIGEITWDGHEKECPAFAGGTGECNCIKSVRMEWHKTRRLREIEVMHAVAHNGGDKYTSELVEENMLLKGKLVKASEFPPFTLTMLDLQASNTALANDLKWARYRIKDMLEGDDGQAWDEAGKFMRMMEAKHGELS